ncbi:hypothetical protein Pcinc_025863 [Petrolisthes cinctipes]|uniref:Transposase n=1 Tax=Petrolisthes cinctipes TaxID=88211 RepID=A0AAE1KD85_PETCI|nr:hypothetical protein Pcinc_025863 [Petrolisthes cinctipes]
MPDDDELANLLDDPDEPGPRSSNRCQEQTPEPSHAGQRPTPEPSHAGQEPTPGPSHAGQEPTPGPSHAGQEPTPGQEQRKLTQPRNRRMIPLWRQMGATNSALDPPEWLGNIEPATTVRNPVEYFRDFFTPDIMHDIVSQSNLYATQKDVTRSLNLSVPEFEQFMGSLFAMSLVKLSSSRLYWKAKLQCPMISENMSRDRWEEIKANVHFNDNSTLPNNNSDKLFKVRPLLTHLAAKFRAIPKPQRLCVDEQMVPFKGRGTHQEKSALVDDVEVRAVKWMDNRSVKLLSTFASVEPKSECKRDCKDLGIPSRKIMMLQEFKLSLAEALLLEGKSVLVRKRGRPSSAGSIAAEFQRKKREFPATKAIPGDEIRTDGYHHYPVVMVREIPAFTRGKKQLSMLETQDTREIASQRIHVERVIGLIRNKYTMLQDTHPLTMLQRDDSGLTCLDKCVRVACALVNMCPSVVPFD